MTLVIVLTRSMTMDPEYVTNKLIDLEDRSRHNNLRIDGKSESRNKTWEECEEEIQKVFNEKLSVKNVHIAQRVTTIVKNQEQ